MINHWGTKCNIFCGNNDANSKSNTKGTYTSSKSMLSNVGDYGISDKNQDWIPNSFQICECFLFFWLPCERLEVQRTSTTSETKLSNFFSDFYSPFKEWVYPATWQYSNDLIQLATLLSCSVPEAYFDTILAMCLLELSFPYFFQSARVFYEYFYNGRPNTQKPWAVREEAEGMPRQ